MKRNIFFLSVALIACTQSSKTESANTTTKDTTVAALLPSKDSIETMAIVTHHSPWLIPLTEYWKDHETFVLLIPDSSGEIAFVTEKKESEVRADTVQGKILETIESELQSCEKNKEFFLISLGSDGKKGKVDCSHVQAVGYLDQGMYKIPDGRVLTLGTMKVKNSGDEDYGCPVVHTLFLYDDKNLYLIEAGNSEHRWRRQRHLSIVNQVAGIAVSGRTDGNQFVISWSEPNVTNELRIEWKGDHARFVSTNVNNLDSDVADLPNDEDRD